MICILYFPSETISHFQVGNLMSFCTIPMHSPQGAQVLHKHISEPLPTLNILVPNLNPWRRKTRHTSWKKSLFCSMIYINLSLILGFPDGTNKEHASPYGRHISDTGLSLGLGTRPGVNKGGMCPAPQRGYLKLASCKNLESQGQASPDVHA